MYDMPSDVEEFLNQRGRKAADERYQQEQDQIAQMRAERKAKEEAREPEKPINWGALSDQEYRDELAKRGIPFHY